MGNEYQSETISPRITWQLDKLHPPSELYITRDDVMVVQGTNTPTGDSITVIGRILTVDNVIMPFQQTLQMPVALTTYFLTIPLAEGFLLSVVALATNAQQRGQTFARVLLNRGSGLLAGATEILIADYVTAAHSVAWPGSTPRFSTEGPGTMGGLLVTVPAAGADWTYTVPASSRIRLQSLMGTLTCSAAVANRVVQLELNDGSGHSVWRGAAQQALVASAVGIVSAGGNATTSTALTTNVMIPLPDACMLGAGQIVRSVTSGIQGADQWSAVWLMAEQWLDRV